MQLIVKIFIIISIINALLVKCQLYTRSDNVTIYEPGLFQDTFSNKPNDSWLFQFYHSFCGHCINFSPIFKEFMVDAKYWNKVIKFGVLDCSAYADFCSKQGVEYFPYFKFYLSKNFSTSTSTGQHLNIQTDTLDHLFESVINEIDVRLNPKELKQMSFNRNTSKLGDNYFFVTGGNEINLKRTILTFFYQLPYPIYYRYKDNKDDYTLIVARGTSRSPYRAQNLDKLYELLDRYLSPRTDKPEVVKDTRVIQSTTNRVYNQDIYASIYYSLTNEINDHLLNNVNKAIVLRDYIEKLYLYSDINKEITGGFKRLLDLLEAKIHILITGENFVMKWSDMMDYSALPVIKPEWKACNGSLPYLRRYPCGLWVLFHALTVNHHKLLLSNQINNDDAQSLMKSIREFIVTFFMCQECAQNFLEETKDYKSLVRNSKDAILYLWTIHNSVNKRLSGASSDDPMAPKISFPSQKVCPKCRIENVKWPQLSQWSRSDVTGYLIAHYSKRVPLNKRLLL